MNYLYFPGCSLRSTGRAFEESMLAVLKALGTPVHELEDWNCCGATSYMSVSELKAFALCARNLALAEQQGEAQGTAQLLVPCAACYLGLSKARRYLNEHQELRAQVNRALSAAALSYHNSTYIRHPLDVLINDVGVDVIASRVTFPLSGLRVACYYGCQLVRPYADFDDQYEPTSMDKLMASLGAEPVPWPLKTRCCGGSLTGTIQPVGQRLSYILLKEAKRRGCDVIATACPLCQFNLECYQKAISRRFKEPVNLPVVYFTQLIGMALGGSERGLGLKRLLVPVSLISRTTVTAGGRSA